VDGQVVGEGRNEAAADQFRRLRWGGELGGHGSPSAAISAIAEEEEARGCGDLSHFRKAEGKWVIWFQPITNFKSWRHAITIRLFRNLSLQFFFYLILAIFYIFQMLAPSVRPYLCPHTSYDFPLHSLTCGPHVSPSSSTSIYL
jgi:hypothetical protein